MRDSYSPPDFLFFHVYEHAFILKVLRTLEESVELWLPLILQLLAAKCSGQPLLSSAFMALRGSSVEQDGIFTDG
jgi:hypothetical protein